MLLECSKKFTSDILGIILILLQDTFVVDFSKCLLVNLKIQQDIHVIEYLLPSYNCFPLTLQNIF